MRRQSRSAYPEASDQELALPRVPPWYRNLNRFPIRQIRLRSVLGPTYPRLTTHCRGTLAPSTERILTSLWLLLPPGSATADGPLDLTATARLRPSTALMDSKFEWRVDPFESLFPNQDSTPPATSGRAILRDISAGTSDHRVRLVFCP